MVFDGKAFAAMRREKLLEKRKAFGALSLGIVAASGNPVTDSYVRIKERNAELLGISLKRYLLTSDASTEETVSLVQEAGSCDGVIVQLPLPEDINTEQVLNAIPPEKDVDGLSLSPIVLPPVAAAVREILDAQNISVSGKNIVVVGKGKLVGAPCAALFKTLGGKVAVLDKQDNLESLQTADVVMLGAGSPHLVTPSMVKEGVVVLDAGTSEQAGVVVGDADPAVAEKASFFTPVPGGIGPVAVVEIFGNLLKLQ